MSFRKFVFEDKVEETRMGKVWVNPSKTTVYGLLNKFEHGIRVLSDTRDVFVWDATDGEHSDFEAALGIEPGIMNARRHWNFEIYKMPTNPSPDLKKLWAEKFKSKPEAIVGYSNWQARNTQKNLDEFLALKNVRRMFGKEEIILGD